MSIPKFLTTIPIAHRGLHDSTHPENSLSAFLCAIDRGYAIELDIHLLKDNTVVVFHDDDLRRAADVDKNLKDCTWDEIKGYCIFNTQEKIPTLKEVLDLVAGKTPLLIEFKTDRKAGLLERETMKLLREYHGEYAVQSFNPMSVKWFKKHAPDIARGQLSSFFTDVSLSWWKKWIVKTLKLNFVVKPDFISYHNIDIPNKYLLRYNIPKLAWVVKDEAEQKRLSEYIDNIIFEDYLPKID